MNESDPVRQLLRETGCEEHVVKGGLEGLVEAWEKTVAQVEAGYPLGLDDYLNDMDGREILGTALGVAGYSVDHTLADRVRAADERLREQVRPAAECLWGYSVGEAAGWTPVANWWYFSLPRRPGPLLIADLEGE